MKRLLTLFCFASILFVYCDDNGDSDPDINQNKPSIVSVSFGCAYSGTTPTHVITTKVLIPERGSVKKLSLYTKSGTEKDSQLNPESGTYTLRNPGASCENTADGSYYFVFTKVDGSRITTEGYPKSN